MNILLMTGARPNFIKVAPLIYSIGKARRSGLPVTFTLVYAGSENDPSLERSLFEDLQIEPPKVWLGVDSRDTIEITSRVMERMEKLLSRGNFDVVIVVDDLASTMATAIVAKKHGVPLAHLVAGTRSFDINMPKEINRLVIDGLSDYLFTAGVSTGTTAGQAKIYNVGNILMDTLRHNISRFRKPQLPGNMDVEEGKYIVLTVNRRKLLSSPDKLKAMLLAIVGAAEGTPVLAPLRGEARRAVLETGVGGITLIPSPGYNEFGWLARNALAVITDSGNVAEEATFNSVPCITLNDYTEHIETVKQGTNILAGEDPERISAALASIMRGDVKPSSIPEHWDGRTADRILQTLLDAIPLL